MEDEEILLNQLVAKNRRALARAITLVESTRPEHRTQAERLLAAIGPRTGQAIRIGISGTPGVGKSTFIERFGLEIIGDGQRVAVLTVDPSSTISGGAILGDKTRMPDLSRHAEAFVRSSPSGLTLGGVARRSREAILLCEAAGFDVVIVETVGVGQSEVSVSEMTDTFLLLLQPAGGDDLQGIKRGIMELAEIVVINKADGELRDAAIRAAADYQNALLLLRARSRHWTTPVTTCSSLHGEGIDKVWALVKDHADCLRRHGEWHERRQQQAEKWFWDETSNLMIERLKNSPGSDERLLEALALVRDKGVPPTTAARDVINAYFGDESAANPDNEGK